MPTRVFTCSADAVVVKDPNGLSLGAGREGHLNVGYMASGYIARTLMKFNLDFSGMYSITAARLRMRSTGNPSAHGAKTTGNFYIQRITSSWSEGTRGGESWYTDNAVEWDNQPSATTTGQYENDWSGNYSSWDEYTITNLVKAWAPTSIGGSGLTNYGIRMRMVSETSGNHAEYYDRYSYPSYAVEIEVDYTDTPANTAPTVTRVTSGLATITNPDELPDRWSNTLIGNWQPKTSIAFTYNDANGQNMSKYRLVVYDASSGGNVLHDSGDVVMSVPSGTTIQHSVPFSLGSGTSYWYTIQVWDSFSTPASNADAATRTEFHVRYGSWLGWIDLQETGVTAAEIAVTPTTTQAGTQRVIFYAGTNAVDSWTGWKTSPGEALSAGYRYIQIGIRLATYTSGTNPSVDKISATWVTAGDAPLPDKWAFNPNADKASIDTTVRRYGSKALKLTGVTADTIVTAKTGVGDNTISVMPNTDYVLTAEVRTDGMLSRTEWEGPQKSACVGLGVYNSGGYLIAGGTGYAETDDETLGTVDDTYDEELFVDAWAVGTDNWSGPSGGWTGIEWGNGGIPAHTYNAHGYFYIRNYTTSTYVGGIRYTDVEIPVTPGDSYEVVCAFTQTAGQKAQVGAQFHDINGNWVASPFIDWNTASGAWQTMKGTITVPANAAYMNPLFSWDLNGQSGSFWLGAGMFTFRKIRQPINLYPEGFKRLALKFKTGPDVTKIKPGIAIDVTSGSHSLWIDGVMLTEGTVAPPWAQGTVAAAGTISAHGATLDASTGAIFRMRGADGGVRDTVELGTSGLVFGGDSEVSSPAAGVLLLPPTVEIAESGTTYEGGELRLLGQGSSADWHIDNYAGALRFFSGGNVVMALTESGGAITAHRKVVANGEAWTDVSFTNSWVNYGGGFGDVQYFKDAMGFVHLRGIMKSGTASAVAFTLPAGYRPGTQYVFAVQQTNAIGRVDINSSGQVTPAQGGSSTWVSLSGITFYAEN